jgi:hypothetical protein
VSVYITDTFAIIDDFLPPQEAEFVWRYIQDEQFEMVHQQKWAKAFRLSDGIPMRAPPYLSDPYEANTKNDIYPTGRGIDLVIKRLKEIAPNHENLIGKFGKDWAFFFARAYLYTANTGLSWHRDNANNATGAYVYYAHPEWDPQWGGEFLVAPGETKQCPIPKTMLYEGKEKFLGSHLDNSFERDVLLETGYGQYILPKPNRLVLLTSGVIHCIKKVDPAAGNKVRATIQGFFQDPADALKPE